ncbi:MAG: ferric reductase-like transmembrane domain-containing protein [Acidimicrobiia bacterium]
MTATAERLVPEARVRTPARDRTFDRAWIVTVVVVANLVVTVGLWLRHGQQHALGDAGGIATAAGQLTGLVGTYLVLVQLLLMARLPWVERHVGFDRLAIWHRWNGFASITLLMAHTALITVGYAQANGVALVDQTRDFVSHFADVLMAFVGLGLLLAVSITSVKMARRRLRRETWYFVHLYAYLGVALGFAHQLAVGSDFSDDAAARYWWVSLYVLVFGSILLWRVAAPLRFNARHRLRVSTVKEEVPGVTSISITGQHLDRIDAQAGQFFLWRFLDRDGWWQAHPFSLSARPTPNRLRITVKQLGDRTRRLQHVRPGTRVFAEGPYGAFTADRRTRRRVVMIAGGIGITPLRALLEAMPGQPGELTLLYRVVSDRDVIFERELADLGKTRGVTVHLITGDEIGDDETDKLGVPALTALVPDVAEAECYVCGPAGLTDAVRRRLRRIGVPRRRIHFERFAY